VVKHFATVHVLLEITMDAIEAEADLGEIVTADHGPVQASGVSLSPS
jgi:hypothetical protein